MRNIAFIGGYDKTDLIIYVGKVLKTMGYKVLFIDTTITSKSQFIVPAMAPAPRYITTFDGVDVALGFESLQVLKQHLGLPVQAELNYDFVLVDFDNPRKYLTFEFNEKDTHFFVTSFDVYSLQRGMSVLRAMRNPTEITKVLFTRTPGSKEDSYIDTLTENYKSVWKNEIIYFPFETDDLWAIYQNQRFSKAKFVGLSNMYIDGIALIVETLTGASKNEVKKTIKVIDKS